MAESYFSRIRRGEAGQQIPTKQDAEPPHAKVEQQSEVAEAARDEDLEHHAGEGRSPHPGKEQRAGACEQREGRVSACDLEINRRLNELLVNINQAFGTEKVAPTFRLFTGEQRAVGEIMIAFLPPNGEIPYECIGYASFVKKMREDEFSKWFTKLRNDIVKIADGKADMERLILLHHRLIDLIDFLDPNCVRVPPKYRTRI